MYVWESYEVQYLANDASKLQTFDEKSVKMLIVWHRRESDIPVDICEWSPISRYPNATKLQTFHVKSVKLWMALHSHKSEIPMDEW